MTEYVAWRVSNRTWSKWHLSPDRRFTVCGKEIPVPVYAPPTYAPLTNQHPIAGACGTCWTYRRQLTGA